FTKFDNHQSFSTPIPYTTLFRSPVNWLDRAVFGAAALNPVIWNAQKEEHFPVPVLLYASSRAVTLNRQLLATLGELSRVPVTFLDRKSTRLNSSHRTISYAVCCL